MTKKESTKKKLVKETLLETFDEAKDKASASTVSAGGIGFVGLLQIVFIVLKLCKVITWSWWLVMLPLIIEVGLLLLAVLLAIILAIIVFASDDDKLECESIEEIDDQENTKVEKAKNIKITQKGNITGGDLVGVTVEKVVTETKKTKE